MSIDVKWLRQRRRINRAFVSLPGRKAQPRVNIEQAAVSIVVAGALDAVAGSFVEIPLMNGTVVCVVAVVDATM
ncbi:7601_t:CDS:2 [Acaulospora colombiana]|uniref:7601_t:CDS:1 n=1 Tax=Acaulospora colombiana TaxID=27376 RepID=A0ACA9LEF0_9GLOM|nr:7601_t:CDS:2 [Acaulospora colombiana]